MGGEMSPNFAAGGSEVLVSGSFFRQCETTAFRMRSQALRMPVLVGRVAGLLGVCSPTRRLGIGPQLASTCKWDWVQWKMRLPTEMPGGQVGGMLVAPDARLANLSDLHADDPAFDVLITWDALRCLFQ